MTVDSSTHSTMYLYLTLAGTIPFLVGTTCLLTGVDLLPGGIPTQSMVSAYALLILSFMAGVHWGQHLHLTGNWRTRLPLASNLIAISAWVGFLVLDFDALCLLLAGGFLVLLWIDRALLNATVISEAYFRTRVMATFIVAVSLILPVTS